MLRFLKKMASGLAGFVMGAIALPFTLLLSVPLSFVHFAYLIRPGSSLPFTIFATAMFSHLYVLWAIPIAAVIALALPVRGFIAGFKEGFGAALKFPLLNQPLIPNEFYTWLRNRQDARLFVPQERAPYQGNLLNDYIAVVQNQNNNAIGPNDDLLQKISSLPETKESLVPLTTEEIDRLNKIVNSQDPATKEKNELRLASYLNYIISFCPIINKSYPKLKNPITCEGSSDGKKWVVTYDLTELKNWIMSCNKDNKIAVLPGVERKHTELTKIKKGLAESVLEFVSDARELIKNWRAPKAILQNEISALTSQHGLLKKSSSNYSLRFHQPVTPKGNNPLSQTTNPGFRSRSRTC